MKNNYDNVCHYINISDTPIEKVIETVKEALSNFTELTKILSYLNGAKIPIDLACSLFNYMNFDNEEGIFDVNFGTIAATIRTDKFKELYVDRNVDVYIDGDMAFSLDASGDFSKILNGYKEED